jgi:anti-sigma regulatory factor (Ser/Thr protein kinase)
MSTPHLVFDLEEPSQIGEARRMAANMAEQLGFDAVASGRVALVVTELGTNLVRHAVQGRLLIAAHDDGASIEVISLDSGPGMADLQRCMADGYTTSSTPGNGLGAVRRLADTFEAFSQVSTGTVVVARVARQARTPYAQTGPKAAFIQGAVAIAAPRETECGDAWSVVQDGGLASVLLVDGLGHGPQAAHAAAVAVEVFEAAPFGVPSDILSRAHDAMRATRGAAGAIAQLDLNLGKATFCGAGNIAGRLISGIEDRTLSSQHGTLGLAVRRLRDVAYDWPDHAILVLHSDGILGRWDLSEAPGLLQCEPTVIAAWLLRGHERGRDDATVVVLRRAVEGCVS